MSAREQRSGGAARIATDTSLRHVAQISVAGPLDAAAQAPLAAAGRRALLDAYVLIVDLRELTACDALGVRAVVALATLAREHDALVVLRPAPDPVQRAFSESEAAASLRFVPS